MIGIPSYEKARVIVYGDLMLDRYWYGEAARISPEAPVPIVRVNEMEVKPGGAANVALNAAALGCPVTLMGLVGQDPEAHELKTALSQQHIDCQFETVPGYPTVTKLRVLGQNQQLLRMDFERIFENYNDSNIIQHYEQALPQSKAVILSDYAKGALFNANVLIQKARSHGIPVFVDPKTTDFNRYRGATLLTPNLKEFEAVAGFCRNENELIDRAVHLIQQFDFDAMLITRGKHGMILIHRNGQYEDYPARASEVYDVTGAGDTVIAVLAASVAAGATLPEAVNLANFAAGLTVRKLGAATISISELRRELQRANDSHVGILSEEELLVTVADARAHGERIVMTNGCFDLLHAGHVDYLEKARALGDRLIVAVNSNESVARLKGAERPLNPLVARMEVLAALRSVDWVVPFSEDTPTRLISQVLPDILVKGSDYQIKDIAGSAAVINNGGEVVTIPLKQGLSTTALIEKIRGVTA